MKVSALNANFSNLNDDLLASKRPAHESAKKGTPLKSGYFTDIGSSSMKTAADRHKHPAYHNKH